MTAMNELTSTEIQARLDELNKAEEAHRARDFDAELAAVLAQGGDVDALEARHLEAERQARRHRVERTALESALPGAQAREAQIRIEQLRAEHEGLRPDAIKARDKALRAAASLEVALKEWAEVSATAARLGHEAAVAARAAKVEVQRFGTFTSRDVSGLPERLMPPLSELSMRAAQMTGPSESLD